MRKDKIIILKNELNSFTNDKTGEVNLLTKITYLIPMNDTEKSNGGAIFVTYKKGDLLSTLKNYLYKICICEFEEIPTNNGFKLSLKKIDNIEL